jgi:hypothetical protein
LKDIQDELALNTSFTSRLMLLTLINEGSEVLQVYSKPSVEAEELADLEVNIFISRISPYSSSDQEPLSPNKNQVI